MLRWETCLEIKKQIETGPMSEYHAVLCVLCGMADAGLSAARWSVRSAGDGAEAISEEIVP